MSGLNKESAAKGHRSEFSFYGSRKVTHDKVRFEARDKGEEC
jgi:hypothetical protein